MGLDLYAKIEPYLGFESQKEWLYTLYQRKVEQLGIDDILDIGCGSGAFLKKMQQSGKKAFGIDLSPVMVQRCKEDGLEAACIDVCELNRTFEAATAMFDVINYIPPANLESFFHCVAGRLRKGGYFLCDINTLYGFEEIAQGSLIINEEDFCIGIDAQFDENRLQTDIVYFARNGKYFTKETDTIMQYYHDIKTLKFKEFELVDIDLVSLYSEEIDKAMLTYKRV